jgi:3-ketosteroid 9alpha-monooxygenase subunit B
LILSIRNVPGGRSDVVDSRGGTETLAAKQAIGGFQRFRVKDVVRETADAISLVFDATAARFRYEAGQFLTLRVEVAGEEHLRCYSMSSSPAVGEDPRITVKREPGGLVSNLLNDVARPGDLIEVSPPAGRFVLGAEDREIVAFAGGSGITPVFSLLRTALATTSRTIRLFYANRDRPSVIFAAELRELAERHSDRLMVEHHLDDERGLVRADEIKAWLAAVDDADFYLCGPGPFMDTVEATLLALGVAEDRLRLERFQVREVPDADQPETEHVAIELQHRVTVVPYRPGTTLLQVARSAGLRAPSLCEAGSCGTCMARVVEGSARMLNNEALTAEEVADGWVLTCQSLPTSPSIRVVYE